MVWGGGGCGYRWGVGAVEGVYGVGRAGAGGGPAPFSREVHCARSERGVAPEPARTRGAVRAYFSPCHSRPRPTHAMTPRGKRATRCHPPHVLELRSEGEGDVPGQRCRVFRLAAREPSSSKARYAAAAPPPSAFRPTAGGRRDRAAAQRRDHLPRAPRTPGAESPSPRVDFLPPSLVSHPTDSHRRVPLAPRRACQRPSKARRRRGSPPTPPSRPRAATTANVVMMAPPPPNHGLRPAPRRRALGALRRARVRRARGLQSRSRARAGARAWAGGRAGGRGRPSNPAARGRGGGRGVGKGEVGDTLKGAVRESPRS